MVGPLTIIMPDTYVADLGERMVAAATFDRINRRRLLRFLRRRFLGQCANLLALNAVGRRVSRRTLAGVQLIPIERIRGTEGRERDFDIDFNPLQEHDKNRWVDVLVAMRSGANLPPVELIQVGEVYYVRDGHHRISAARQLGMREIEAEVTVWE